MNAFLSAALLSAGLFGAAMPALAQADPPAVQAAAASDRDSLRARIAAAKTEGVVSYWDAVIQPETNTELTEAFRKAYGLPNNFPVKYTLSATLSLVTRSRRSIPAMSRST